LEKFHVKLEKTTAKPCKIQMNIHNVSMTNIPAYNFSPELQNLNSLEKKVYHHDDKLSGFFYTIYLVVDKRSQETDLQNVEIHINCIVNELHHEHQREAHSNQRVDANKNAHDTD
jgi:hypothetical protein